VNPCHQTSFFEMLKYFVLFAALSAAVRAQDNLMDDLLEQEMELPCTPKPCVPICKPVTKYVSYGAFKLPYTENVCVDDKACLTANAKCIATLHAAMKAAEAAEKDMIAKSKAANSAKATKAQKDAAAASKKAEEAAAKKALDGAKAAFEVAEKETATAKAHSVAAAAAFAAKDKVMNTRLVEYEKAKAGHLNAQKAYSNAKGEAAKAADAYAAAVKAHCDAEAVHAAAVENIGHGHLKKDECKKHETGTGARLVFKGKGCKTQGRNLGTSFKTPEACLAKAKIDATCKDGNVMWAPKYNYAWGCRCCAETGGTKDHKNPNWEIYGSADEFDDNFDDMVEKGQLNSEKSKSEAATAGANSAKNNAEKSKKHFFDQLKKRSIIKHMMHFGQ